MRYDEQLGQRIPDMRSGLGVGIAVVAVLLVVVVLRTASGPAEAAAQSTATPPFNATAQRDQMVKKLNELNSRLQRIESKLDSGISVKVTDMPAVQVRQD